MGSPESLCWQAGGGECQYFCIVGECQHFCIIVSDGLTPCGKHTGAVNQSAVLSFYSGSSWPRCSSESESVSLFELLLASVVRLRLPMLSGAVQSIAACRSALTS